MADERRDDRCGCLLLLLPLALDALEHCTGCLIDVEDSKHSSQMKVMFLR